MNGKLSELFRDIESEQGAHELMILCLKSIRDAVNNYKGDNLIKEFKSLVDGVYKTEPKIALVIDQFYSVMDYLFDQCREYFEGENHNSCNIKKTIDEAISKILKMREYRELVLCENGQKMIDDGDVILIHSHSRSVTRVLREAHEDGKKFEVIVAEQEFDKTISILKLLQEKDIPVKVVPEYMLSHIEDDITKVFMGVVTLNSQMSFIATAGTLGVVSEFHLSKIPIYVFMTTGKFSLWKLKKRHHTYKVKHKKFSSVHDIEYDRIKFSHDRVPLNYINHIVTDEGIFNPEEIEKLYWEKYKEREEWNIQHDW